MMNAIMCSSEVSDYYEQINGTTVFYSFLPDAEISLRKGMNSIYTLAEIGQQSTSNSYNSDDAMLNDT